MARNHKLTGVLQGRKLSRIQQRGRSLTIGFDDGSVMMVKAAGPLDRSSTRGTVRAVRQQDTQLILDFEDGSALEIATREPTSCVMVRDKSHTLEYAD